MVDVVRPEDDVMAARGVLEVELVLPQDEVAAHGVVDDETARRGVVDDDQRD
jgi:predicted carbohydrate-binding protein with CBM5 and CBM33 domain